MSAASSYFAFSALYCFPVNTSNQVLPRESLLYMDFKNIIAPQGYFMMQALIAWSRKINKIDDHHNSWLQMFFVM